MPNWISIVGGVVVLAIAVLLWMNLRHGWMSGRLRDADGVYVFDLDYHKVNSLLLFEVWSSPEGELLWKCDAGRTRPEEIVYGTVPVGARQAFPENGTPDSLSPGREVVVRVVYQYDVGITAASGRSGFKCAVPESGGTVELAAEPQAWSWGNPVVRDE